MNIYMLCSPEESTHSFKFPTYIGYFSYIARGKNLLLSEKFSDNTSGDMMVVSMQNADESVTLPIYDECKRRGYSAVFLDTDELPKKENSNIFSKVSASLEKHGLSTFCPLAFANFCPRSIPVADGTVTGGVFEDELANFKKRHHRIGISISRIISRFEMPVSDAEGTLLTPTDLRRFLQAFDGNIFFSPQLMTNYFLLSTCGSKCRYILFDDADTISKKLRTAKKLGFSDVFLIQREISDIARDIRI